MTTAVAINHQGSHTVIEQLHRCQLRRAGEDHERGCETKTAADDGARHSDTEDEPERRDADQQWGRRACAVTQANMARGWSIADRSLLEAGQAP